MSNSLTSGDIPKNLLKMSLSMGLGIMAIIGFNIADTYFIGQLGKTELAAISLTFPVVTIFFSLALGTSAAITALVSTSIGEGDEKKVKRYTSDGLTFALIIVFFSVVVGFVFMDPIFIALGATDQTLPIVKEYMTVWFSGIIFLTVPMAGNGAIRAQGDMKTAAAIMIWSAIINIILDPIFIFGFGFIPAFGVKGAAIATVIARAMTLFASVGILHFKYQMIDFGIPKIKDAIDSWKNILKIAIPISGTNLLSPLAVAFATAMVARLGENEIATYGIVSRVESFALIFVFALSSALGPMLGQNYGAHNSLRVESAIKSSFHFSLIWGLFAAVTLYFLGGIITSAFSNVIEIRELGSFYLTIVPISFGLFGVKIISSTIFNTLGDPLKATYIGFLNFIVLFIPAIYIGTKYFGFKGVTYSHLITNLLIGIFSFFYVKKSISKKLELA